MLRCAVLSYTGCYFHELSLSFFLSSPTYVCMCYAMLCYANCAVLCDRQERFPLIVDPSGQAMRFLKYQLGSFFRSDDLVAFTKERLNVALAGALQHGKTMTLHFPSLAGVGMELFQPGLFPAQVVDRAELMKDGVWQSVFSAATLGDTSIDEISPSPDFVFIVCTEDVFVPLLLSESMGVICIDQGKRGAAGGDVDGAGGDADMDAIAEMYGAKETIR
jgi:hypothetical protein